MGKKILIADDSSLMRNIIKSTLIKNGYTDIIEAADGESACKLFDEEQPSLVFLDLIMKNKSGLEALTYIKTAYPDSKVVICSSMSQQTIVTEAIKLGAVDFIVKPFKEDAILNAVSKYL